jgi:hypothetical protein
MGSTRTPLYEVHRGVPPSFPNESEMSEKERRGNLFWALILAATLGIPATVTGLEIGLYLERHLPFLDDGGGGMGFMTGAGLPVALVFGCAGAALGGWLGWRRPTARRQDPPGC